ncbi:hypothetical protein [Mycoplasmopsis alligatoris]|uniref:hypothetical protein n=1 Tax=Mycoplasmopsis alligatoris TaxID=47687 RepID=UPI000306C380|nr:hypothetical protein [Mycoplasmopsis alligatoris]
MNLKANFLNYRTRKILVLIVTILLVVIITLFSMQAILYKQRIIFEREWISQGYFAEELSPHEIEAAIATNLHSYNLIPLFSAFISIVFALLGISLILLISGQIKIYKNLNNANKEIKAAIYLIGFSLLFGFIFLSVQPVDIKRSFYSEDFGQEILQTHDRISYAYSFIAFGLMFLCFILIISSIRKYGYLTKDKILSKQFLETTKLNNEIKELLNS